MNEIKTLTMQTMRIRVV